MRHDYQQGGPGPVAPVRSVSWLAKAWGRHLPSAPRHRRAAIPGRPAARGPGGATSSPSATSRSDRAAPARLPTRAARPAGPWSAWASCSQGAGPTAYPAHSPRRRAASSSSKAAESGIGQTQPDRLDVTGPQRVPGGGRFRRPDPGNGLWIGARMRRLAVRDGDQAQPGPGGGEHGHRPAHAQDLVIGMSGDDRRTRPAPRISGPEVRSARPRSSRFPRRFRAGRCGSARPG